MAGRRRKGRPVHGWLIVDKPAGITSTQVLGRVRRLIGAEKAGHGGTLDPLATGILPIAFGEATKTVSYVMDGTKTYRFTVRWGEARTTDDREGAVIATSDMRPTEQAVHEVLGRFVGEITQVPPIFSAIKVDGARAYDLAREGQDVALKPRQVRIDRIALLDMADTDHATFEVVCGKGTYVRSLARDLAAALGTVGHVASLDRSAVGRFTRDRAISLDELAGFEHGAAVDHLLLPIETALDDIPALALTEAEAHRLRLGQSVVLLRRDDRERLDGLGLDRPRSHSTILAMSGDKPVALVRVDGAEVRPVRVLNL